MGSPPRAIPLLLLIATALGASGLAAHYWMARRDVERSNAQMDARLHDLEREHEAAVVKNKTLEQQVESARAAEQQLQAEKNQQALELAAFRKREEERNNPTRRTCTDSDARLGADAIYVQGFVEVGGGARVSDHCRLGQLVEFRCIENPQGSGRFLSDATMVDCPQGSRCVSGECLR